MPKLRLVFTALSIAAGIVFVDRAAQALPVEGFTGAFAVGNWIYNPSSSLVDTTGAPKSIAISSPDDGSGLDGESGFEITLPSQSYALSFAWNYATTDANPSFDPFGYSVNGIFTPISDGFGANTQAGFTKLVLSPGDLFAFTALGDNTGGSATTVISAFGAGLPDEVSDCNDQCFDFGDAPDSYQTNAASNGPLYQEGYLQRIGLNWDYEPNGQPTFLANGDDINLDGAFGPGTPPLVVDDEDGIAFGPDWVDVLVNIKRADPHAYSLRGWWDLDNSKTFDHDSEMKLNRTLLGLTPGLFTIREYLSFDPSAYYSRFRLTWIDDPTGVDGGVSLTTDIQPYGVYKSRASFPGFGSSHGEVEDAPGPLPVLGAAAALGWSRRLKARIKAAR